MFITNIYTIIIVFNLYPPLKHLKQLKDSLRGMNSPDVGDSNECVCKDEKLHEWSPET